jgi:hypothetical protein
LTLNANRHREELGTHVPPRRPFRTDKCDVRIGENVFGGDLLPSVPPGNVEAMCSVAGRRSSSRGVGYHDHNWGNAPMPKLMHHWYWAPGAVGPFAVIPSHITAEKQYGYSALPVFMLARDGKLIADDHNKVIFDELGRYTR